MKKELVIIAHNIRSAYNVGAIFRTADGMGAKRLYLTGFSPSPQKEGAIREDSYHKKIAKTALGAEKSLGWRKKGRISPLIKKLKEEGFKIVALEQNENSVDYRKFNPKYPMALILGNEPKGIDRKILKICDAIIEIPMRGKKNSLNVAVALGIAGYEIMR